MIDHEHKGEGTRGSDSRRELSRKKEDHRYGKDSRDERDDPEVSLRFCEGIKEMGKDEEKRRMQVVGLLLIIGQLVVKTIS